MREFDEIKDMVYGEIDNIARQGSLNNEALCVLGELVDILKDIGTVEMFEEGIQVPENEYSLASGYRNGSIHRNDDSGYSYRGGRNYYSDYPRRGRGSYSRDDAHEHMISQLHNIMNDAENEDDRQAVKRLIDQMGK